LNTVAVQFLFDIDNMAFEYFLDERIRQRVEQAGRVDLTDKDALSLKRARSSNAFLLPVAVVVAVWSGVLQSFLAVFPAFIATFLANGYCEMCKMRDQGATPTATAIAIARVTGGVLCGVVVFLAFYALAYVI
jgi:hypothetical protein